MPAPLKKTLSDDQRRAVRIALDKGIQPMEIAKRFRCTLKAVMDAAGKG